MPSEDQPSRTPLNGYGIRTRQPLSVTSTWSSSFTPSGSSSAPKYASRHITMPGLITRSGFGGCGSSAKAALGPSSSRPAECESASYRRARYRSGRSGTRCANSRNVMPGRRASRAAASQSWAARYVPRCAGVGSGVATEERPGQVDEIPLPAEGVGIDEDQLALAHGALGRLEIPGVRVGAGHDGTGDQVLAAVAQQDVRHLREDVDLAQARLHGRLDRAHQPHAELGVDLEGLQLLRRLHLARVHAERPDVGEPEAPVGQRQ